MTKKTTTQVTDNKSFNINFTLTKQPNYVPNTSILNIQIDPLPLVNKIYRQHIIFIADVSTSMRRGKYMGPNKTNWVPSPEHDGILLSKEAIIQVLEVMSKTETDTTVSGIIFSDKAKIFLNKRPLSKTLEGMDALKAEIKENTDFDMEGWTDFIEAISAIQDDWLESENVRIYFLTDGEHNPTNENHKAEKIGNVSNHVLDKLATKAKVSVDKLKLKCTIYAFGVTEAADEKAIAPLYKTTHGDFFHMKENKDIPRFMETIANSVTSFKVNVHVKSCMIKLGEQLKHYINFETDTMNGLDKQAHGFQLSNDAFSDAASIHFLLVDENKSEVGWVVYEGLAHLPDNPHRDIDELALFYTRSAAGIGLNNMRSVTQRIGDLKELKQNIQRTLKEEKDIKENNQSALERTCNEIDNSIKEIEQGNDISAVMHKFTLSTGNMFIYGKLNAIKNESKKISAKKSKSTRVNQSTGIEEAPRYSPNTLPIKTFISDNKMSNTVTYYEQPPTSIRIVLLEAETQRLITVIEPQDLEYLLTHTSKFSSKTDPISLVERVFKFFKPMDEKNELSVNSIIEAGKKKYPFPSHKEVFLKFGDFILNRVGNSVHRAIALAMLMAAHMKKDDSTQIKIYHSFSFTGKPHAIVLLEVDEQIFVADPVFNMFENIKNPIVRPNVFGAYTINDLEGFLYLLATDKNWNYPLSVVPLIPELTEEEDMAALKYDLLCAISTRIMRVPVYLYSATQAQIDKKNDVLFLKQGIVEPHAFEKKDIEDYLDKNKGNALNPYTGVPLPADCKTISAQDMAQTIWGFLLMVADKRPGAFLCLAEDEFKPSKAYLDLQRNRSEKIKKLFERHMQEQKSIQQIPTYYARRLPPKAPALLSEEKDVKPYDGPLVVPPVPNENKNSSTNNTDKKTEIKTPLSAEKFSKIQIYLANKKHLTIKFINVEECKKFYELCGHSNVPEEYIQRPKEANNKDEQKLIIQAGENDEYNKTWQTPIRFNDTTDVALFCSRSIVNGTDSYCFKQFKVVENILELLKLPKDVSPFVGHEEITFYAGGNLVAYKDKANNGIITLLPNSYLLNEGACLEIENGQVTKKNYIRTANGVVDKNVTTTTANTGLTSRVATFSSSTSSSRPSPDNSKSDGADPDRCLIM